MISVTDLSKSYGNNRLFQGASFTLGSGERVGLIGRNGHGKTTLFRMIIGDEVPDSGNITVPKGYNIGYLRQEISHSQSSVLAECLDLDSEIKPQEWEARRILLGLGFTEYDLERDPGELSGGYCIRLNLAKALLAEPDLLLLDEPTNFLDILSIRWLENFLRAWKGEIMLITHDRVFMDRVATHIMGIHRQNIRKMAGDTHDFYSIIDLEEETWERQRLNQEKKRRQTEEFINKFRAKARQANLVQSRVKALEKIDKKEQLKAIPTLSFSFTSCDFPSKYLMESHRISYAWNREIGDIIQDFSLTVEKGDRIFIVGKNGAGKTTLLKLLYGKIMPCLGEVRRHNSLEMAYYEQANTALLRPDFTIEDELSSVNLSGERKKIMDVCGFMMFSGDDSKKKIRILSGGEKCRVLIGKLLLSPTNLLMLDEPTHHLDIQSCQAMGRALVDFDGTSIVVSHDEALLHQVANKLIIFKDDKITVFPGTYQEFLDRYGWGDEENHKPTSHARKKLQKDQAPRNVSEKSGISLGEFEAHEDCDNRKGRWDHEERGSRGDRKDRGDCEDRGDRKEIKQIRAQFFKRRKGEMGPLEKKIGELEGEIARLECAILQIHENLVEASNSGNHEEIKKLNQESKLFQEKLDNSWEELSETTEKIELIKDDFEKEALALGIEN